MRKSMFLAVCYAVALSLLAACISADKKREKIEANIAASKHAVDTNQWAQIDEAKGWNHAAQNVLKRETNNTPELKLARDFTDRVGLVLGPPSYEEALRIDDMVNDLLSVQQKEIERGREALAERDARMVSLQDNEKILEQKVSIAEKARDEAYKIAAAQAAKWQRLKWFFYKIGFGLGGLVLLTVGLKVGALFLGVPALGSAPDFVIGKLFRAGSRVFSGASKAAGVVAQDEHDVVNTALTRIVGAIQDLREKKPAVFEQELEPLLKDKLPAWGEGVREKIGTIVHDLKAVA